MTIIDLLLMFLILLKISNCDDSTNNNSTLFYFDNLDDNSTLLNDLLELNQDNSTASIIPSLIITTTTTNKPDNENFPIHLNSSSKINQLLESIDDHLRNSSMLLDSHVLVVQKANGTVNLSRTWTFHPDKFKSSEVKKEIR